MESRILQEYQSDSYTIGNPLIKVNPYGISPLSALVWLKTKCIKDSPKAAIFPEAAALGLWCEGVALAGDFG